VPLWSKIRRRD